MKKEYVVVYPAVLIRENWKGLKDEHVDIESGEAEYLLPNEELSEVAYLEVRMRSTRAGNNARYVIPEIANQYLNNAPFEPVFRGFVKNFRWAPPEDAMTERDGDLLYIPYEEDEENIIWQGGSAVMNWIAEVVDRPAPDYSYDNNHPTRQHLRQILRQELLSFHLSLAYEQGSLELYRCDYEVREEKYCLKLNTLDTTTVIPAPPYRYSRRIFNHFIANGGVITRNNDLFLIWIGDDAVILAEDHEPIFPQKGYYIARHPIPDSGGID